jgi:ferredoxin
MLKRVMRRALRGDTRKEREAPRPAASRPAAPKPPAPAQPAATATTQPAAAPVTAQGSIAARLAGGLLRNPADQVKATSGSSAYAIQDTELHSAQDGVQYWGALDNESARSKAAGETLVIDQWECISCGTCVENTDAVFVLPDDAKAVPIRQVGDMELIQDAIDACPVTCIHWSLEPTEFEQLNDADGHPTD